MNGMELKDNIIKAIVIHDKHEGCYTIFPKEDNGPIVSAKTEEEAKKMFTEAVKLSSAVRNLRYFSQAVKASDENRKDFSKKINPVDPNIQFLETEFDIAC